MSTSKIFRLLIGPIVLVLLICLTGCPESNPPAPSPAPTQTTEPSCPCPKPLIMCLEAGSFMINPDTLSGATSVTVLVANAQGSIIDTLNLNPGQDMALVYPENILRPFQLRFVYKSSTGAVIAESCLRVEDSGGNGIVFPDVDVIMGVISSPPPSCGTINNSQIGSGVGQISFDWMPDTLYEVRFTPSGGGSSKSIRLRTTDGPSDLPGITKVFNHLGYQCLSNMELKNPIQNSAFNTKVLKVSVNSAEDCTITGKDNNAGNNNRVINIVGPAGWTISVWK